MQITKDQCPRCKAKRIDRDNRICLNCFQTVLFPGDDGGRHREDDEWFMWQDRGLYGRAGWFRRAHFEVRVISDSPLADATDPYAQLAGF